MLLVLISTRHQSKMYKGSNCYILTGTVIHAIYENAINSLLVKLFCW